MKGKSRLVSLWNAISTNADSLCCREKNEVMKEMKFLTVTIFISDYIK